MLYVYDCIYIYVTHTLLLLAAAPASRGRWDRRAKTPAGLISRPQDTIV